MTVNKINFNSDLGEQDEFFFNKVDKPLLKQINSANVSCLFHGGYHDVVKKVVYECQKQEVSIGAHVSFNDKENFGRKIQSWNKQSLHDLLSIQIQFMIDITKDFHMSISHLKPHGALNTLACRDEDLAYEITSFINKFYPNLIILAPSLSLLADASHNEGLQTALEVFADRTYEDDGSLSPRSIQGTLIEDPILSQRHLKKMITEKAIISRNGLILKTPFHSICLHSDTPNSVEISKQICILLQSMNIKQKTLPELF